MPEEKTYYVSIDNEESNEKADNLSMTGRVNGVQCAAVMRISSLPKDSKKRKAAKQRALIEAFINREEGKAPSAGEAVTV